MTTNQDVLLQRIADTLDAILLEIRRSNERREQVDRSEAEAAEAMKHRYEGL